MLKKTFLYYFCFQWYIFHQVCKWIDKFEVALFQKIDQFILKQVDFIKGDELKKIISICFYQNLG